MSENREEDQKKVQQNEQESEEKFSFLQETVKDEQVTGKNIWNSVWSAVGKSAGRGLVFGMAACLVFYALKPWASTHLGESEVTIPQDVEAEENKQEPIEEETQGEVTDYPELTVENYRELNRAMYQVAAEAGKSVVEVVAVRENEGWENSKFDAGVSVSGVIVWDDGTEVLILAPSRILKESGKVSIKFSDYSKYEAVVKKQDRNLGLAVFSVKREQLSETTRNQITVATLGNSNTVNRGDTVIVMGKQFGYAGGVGYGIVSSVRNRVVLADGEYRILTTDISAAENGSGVLFNLSGEVIGMADQTITESNRLVTAYAISGIKEAIELLSNGRGVPYLGIHGVEVTESISEEQGIPKGLYVKEVEADSPAMNAGIQCGDVITQINKTDISSGTGYAKKLREFNVGDQIKVKGKRQGASGYVEVTFDVSVGSKE